MIKTESFVVNENESGRVDKIATLHGISRSVFNLSSLTLTINGKSAKKSQKVSTNDAVALSYEEEVFTNVEPQDLPLDVLYEDDDILVINKKSGMVVHPAPGNYTGTLVNALLYRYGEDFNTQEDEDEECVIRPGIVHRLDKDTSGVLVVAKNGFAHQELARQFSEHTTNKYYVAVVKGNLNTKKGSIEKRIARSSKDRKLFEVTESESKGKYALTHYTLLKNYKGYAFVKLKLETGRTHQIRVHLKSIGHPIVGDVLYSRKDEKFPSVELLLHSLSLEIIHPRTKEVMKFVAPLPKRFSQTLLSLLD